MSKITNAIFALLTITIITILITVVLWAFKPNEKEIAEGNYGKISNYIIKNYPDALIIDHSVTGDTVLNATKTVVYCYDTKHQFKFQEQFDLNGKLIEDTVYDYNFMLNFYNSCNKLMIDIDENKDFDNINYFMRVMPDCVTGVYIFIDDNVGLDTIGNLNSFLYSCTDAIRNNSETGAYIQFEIMQCPSDIYNEILESDYGNFIYNYTDDIKGAHGFHYLEGLTEHRFISVGYIDDDNRIGDEYNKYDIVSFDGEPNATHKLRMRVYEVDKD